MHFCCIVRNLIQKQNITNCKLAINGGIKLSNSVINQCCKVKSLHLRPNFQSRKNEFYFSRNFSTTAVVFQRSAEDKERFKNYVVSGIMLLLGLGVFVVLFLMRTNYDIVYVKPAEKK